MNVQKSLIYIFVNVEKFDFLQRWIFMTKIGKKEKLLFFSNFIISNS